MRVLITGATGFIGSHIAKAVQALGHSVIGCVRDPKLGQQLNPKISYIACDFAHDVNVNDWLPRLQNIDVVINAVGIITETGANTFDAIHYVTPKALFDACKIAGVSRIIQISALGVSQNAHTPYNDTKMQADNYLCASDNQAVILRPSWLYGERSRSFEVLCAFSALPVIPVVGAGQYLVQPIHIEDFALAVAQLITNDSLDGQIIEAGGPQQLTIKTIHGALKHWLNLGAAKFMSVPEAVVKWIVKFGDHVFKGPINTASFDMLTRNNVTEDSRLWQAVNITPQTLSATLALHPSLPAERLYARLFFLLPLLRFSLAFVWLATAIVTAFVTPRNVTLGLFADAGIRGFFAEVLLYGSAAVDFFLGLTLLFHYRLRLFGAVQILLILFYTLFISVSIPQWWLHPFGPIIKNIPIVVATLIIMVAAR